MTSEYHRARRSYVVVSGVLLAWELVGLTVSDVPVANFRVNLTTPDAAPHLLAIVTFYLLVRFTVEWQACAERERRQNTTRFDVGLTHVIGIGALVVYALNRWAGVRVGETIDATLPVALVLGFMAALGVAEVYRYFRERQTDRLRLFTFCSIAGLPVLVAVILAMSSGSPLAAAIASILGAVFGLAVWRILRSLLAARPPNKALEPSARN